MISNFLTTKLTTWLTAILLAGGLLVPIQSLQAEEAEKSLSQAWTPEPESGWCRDFQSMLKKIDEAKLKVSGIQVQSAPGGLLLPRYFFRLKASSKVVELLCKEYEMKHIAADHKFTKEFARVFPAAWTQPKEEVVWYAWPHSHSDPAIDLYFWKILLLDKKNGEIYFYYFMDGGIET